jgi:branched-chain amino acid transport system substrate-binding protein
MNEADRNALPRREFLRRTGALGIAGASALGFSLIEPPHGLASPPRTVAAVPAVTVKLGYMDGFSGVYAGTAAAQFQGFQAGVAAAQKKNARVRFDIVTGDDTSSLAVGSNEVKRLVGQQHIDALVGTASSGVGLAVSALCEEIGMLFVAVGCHDSNMTGAKANRVCFRTAPNDSMLANAVGPAILQLGKRWYFVIADYAFGNDAHDRLLKILLAHGGKEAGADRHPLGASDFSSIMTKARNSDADVMVFCNYGPDTINATKAYADLGLHKQMAAAGMVTGNDVAAGMPVDVLTGSVWGYDWGADAGGNSEELYHRLAPLARDFPPSWRQYLGYIAGSQIVDRILAAGTTDTSTLVKAFEGHRFDGAKSQPSYWRRCDHQNVQETYAARIVAKNKRRRANDYFEIVARVGGEFAAGDCSNPDSAAAQKAIENESIAVRSDYTPSTVK